MNGMWRDIKELLIREEKTFVYGYNWYCYLRVWEFDLRSKVFSSIYEWMIYLGFSNCEEGGIMGLRDHWFGRVWGSILFFVLVGMVNVGI